jgi:methylated-DNA-[protein]-cysteine S-methyltransferase
VPSSDPATAAPSWVASLAADLGAYFGGNAVIPMLPEGLLPPVTRFREAVYAAVRAIPHGSTLPSRAVAVLVGRPGAARAVGAAMADNAIAPLIPCHRVVGSDGGLRGYAGGLDMKQRLIDMEAGHG